MNIIHINGSSKNTNNLCVFVTLRQSVFLFVSQKYRKVKFYFWRLHSVCKKTLRLLNNKTLDMFSSLNLNSFLSGSLCLLCESLCDFLLHRDSQRFFTEIHRE